jgi:hypothetical protein
MIFKALWAFRFISPPALAVIRVLFTSSRDQLGDITAHWGTEAQRQSNMLQ